MASQLSRSVIGLTGLAVAIPRISPNRNVYRASSHLRVRQRRTSVMPHPFPRPNRQGKARWTMRWKLALNAFAIAFSDRFPAAETY